MTILYGVKVKRGKDFVWVPDTKKDIPRLFETKEQAEYYASVVWKRDYIIKEYQV